MSNFIFSQTISYPQFTSTGNPQADSANYQTALNAYSNAKLALIGNSSVNRKAGTGHNSSTSNSLTPRLAAGPNCIIPRDNSWIALPRNDDSTFGPVTLGFNFDLYGTTYNQVWINTNGNLTFTGPYFVFTASGFPFNVPMVAAFWSDEDTRVACGGTGQIFYKLEATRLLVTWENVGYFDQHCDKTVTFQMVIGTTNDPVIGLGQNVLFNFGDMNWTTGDASGGTSGFGGTPATSGINKGDGTAFVQIGRFDHAGTDYDGGGGVADGVDYLDNRCYAFNVSSATNIPPSFSGLPAGNTITLSTGSTVNLAVQAIGPEVNQTVTTTVNTNGVCGITSSTTNGLVSTTNLIINGLACNVGTNTITLTATDNGSPTGTTTVTLTINVIQSNCIVGNRLYVDTSAAPGGNGASWACAFKQLYDAIEYANNTPAVTEIWIADGVYKPRNNGNRGEHFNLARQGLRIVGGFSGNETSESQSNVIGNPTILSGDVGTTGNSSDNSYHLFILNNPSGSGQLLFKSLVMQGGNATDVAGVMYAYNAADLFFDSCIVQNNYAPTGGAFYLNNSTARYQFCIIQNNSAVYGGVFFTFQSNVSFNRVFLLNNTAAAGGAYYGNYGNPVFKDVLFYQNTATDGGAVYQNNMNATYLNPVMIGNTATLGGGIYLHAGSTARLVNGTLYGNTATNSGGAIYVGTGNPNLMAYNTIFWNNRRAGNTSIAGSDIGFLTVGTPLTVQYGMLQAGTAVGADNGTTLSNNVRGVDPQFRSESNLMGVDGAWFTQDDGLQLTSSSPAVNSGNNAIVMSNGLIQDPTDYARIMCGTVDRGAFELQTCMNPTLAEEENAAAVTVLAGIVRTREGAQATGLVANPFSSELQVRYSGQEKASISIVNAAGKMIATKAGATSGVYRFDAAAWGKGLYLITITTADKQVVTLKAIRL